MFDRSDSINYLLKVTASDDQNAADALAERLGNLPLALAQAAATARNGNLSLDRYLDRLDSYGTERVIHPIPGDFYTDDVTTALWMAVEEAYEAMKYDIKVRAQRQIGALALLAESGIPTQWLDPTIEQRGNREVEDTREAADKNAHDALNELIRRNIIQQSADEEPRYYIVLRLMLYGHNGMPTKKRTRVTPLLSYYLMSMLKVSHSPIQTAG